MREIILACAICLGACDALVPSTLQMLQEFDPLSADPADIALRVELPDTVGILPGSGTLNLRAQHRDGTEVGRSFAVAQVGDVLQVDPSERAELRQVQARIRTWEAADPNGTHGSLGVDLEPCRTGADVPDDATFSIGIRVVADGPFLPLVQKAPLTDLLDKQTVADMRRCS
ncbi:hypothetical protein [uncultured Tateyamaria sp.]|uniref:hypothetical protein n=1 Tax=Tateyamaria sp. 1078 TaxID=3417464 RepID=UPI00262CDDC8|nr:hypothetical protein [uncultured Tateyamaria sp.]